MKLSGRSFIITLLFVAALLIALIGFLLYRIFADTPADNTPSATLFIVDSSQRMGDPIAQGNLTKLEAAQQVVQDSVNRLPQSEVIGVHVFGSGRFEPSCNDTFALVPPGTENSEEVITSVNTLMAGTEEAAMVQAAAEAVDELGKTGFEGNANLIFVIGGNPTCNLNEELISRAASPYRIEISTVIISLQSERDAGEGFTFESPFENQEIEIGSPEEIAGLVPTLFPRDEIPNLNPEEPAPTETPIAPILDPPTATNTSTPDSQVETSPTEQSTQPPPPPSPTPQPTDTVAPTATDVPPTVPVFSTPTIDGTETPVTNETETPTETSVPSTVAATNTPIPTNTPTNIPPANTPTPNTGTSQPPTAEPVSEITISDTFIDESSGTVVVVLSRSNRNSKRVLVNYDTANGTALAGQDYVAKSGQTVWEANEEGEKNIIINLLDDQVLEPNETFSVNLSNVVNANLARASAQITIRDNESGDVIINPTNISVSESAGNTSATVTLNGAPAGDVTFSLSSSNGNVCIPNGSVTLNNSNWNSGATISITIVDNPDENASGVDQCTIITSPTTSSNPSFNGINPADIAIQILDNDATYVNGTCADADGNGICDDGIRFRTIQAAINNGISNSPELKIVIASSPHTESGISVNRAINLSGPGGTVLQAAGSPGTAGNRIMTIQNGVSATLNSLTLQNGNVSGSNGGAILNNGSLTLQDVSFLNNRASGSGGAIAVSATGSLNDTAGGIYDTNISGNCGGAIYVPIGGNASIAQTDFKRNEAVNGGALCADGSMSILGGEISGNSASSNGGALYVNSSSEPSIDSTTVSSNVATNGGAVYINDGSNFRTGGSTYSFNQASGGAGGALLARGDLTTWNVTVSSNQSDSGSAGIEHQAGVANIYNTTIAFNLSLAGSPSGISSNTATLFNTILDGNTNGDCAGNINLFFALIGSVPGSCTVSELPDSISQINKTALLEELVVSSGDTATHRPSAGSDAIDNGWPVGQGCEGQDQTGTNRPLGNGCDIGSVERN